MVLKMCIDHRSDCIFCLAHPPEIYYSITVDKLLYLYSFLVS